MTSLSVPLEHYPGMSPFVLDWMRGEPRATQFLPRWSAPVNSTPRGDRAELLSALYESNKRWGLFVDEQLTRWAAGDSLTIVAGQQVGFAGGPLYTLAKIASVIKMKRDLERAGNKVTAFFWLATEDHDFDEVARLSLPVSSISSGDVNRQLDLLCIRTTRAVETKHVVGELAVPEALIAELLALYRMERPPWLRSGINFRDSFAELIAPIVANEMVLVDALLPALRRAGAPLFESIFSKWDDLQRALAYRSGELESAGYGTQVVAGDEDKYTLLFDVDRETGERRIIKAPRAIEPERISTSALTRPLLQDYVLQPDIFIGGPAEVAYYAQITPLHDILSVQMPRVALRGHVLVAPRSVLRFVERFAIAPDEMFSSPDEVLTKREPEGVREIRRLADEARQQLTKFVSRAGEIALPADHSLARAISRSTGHLEYHVNKFTERAIKSLVRKDRERYAAARELVATLYPDRHVQDRVLGWFPFWHEQGQHFIDRLTAEVEPDAPSFKVISI